MISKLRGFRKTKRLVRNLFFDLDRALSRLYQENKDEFVFVQVGANDGVTNDPIHDFVTRYKPRGVLVEPQTNAFNRLTETYRGSKFSNLKLLNCAIASQESITLWRIKPAFERIYKQHYKETANASGITSFSRAHVESFLTKVMPNYFQDSSFDEAIESIQVPACNWEGLFRICGFKNVTFLQCDVEGYDAELLRMVLSGHEQWLPKAINFESKALCPDELAVLLGELVGNGYRVKRHGGDTFCVRN